jgi:hypothetical protein
VTTGNSPQPRWQPLSVRQGASDPAGPFEGVPAHLTQTVDEWLASTLMSHGRDYADLAEGIALQLQVTGNASSFRSTWLRNAALQDEEKALDILDAVLYWSRGSTAAELNVALSLAGSVWEVSDTKLGLVRRVSTADSDSYADAVTPGDAAAGDLRTAWSKVYGRQPDYSDAWDHAIKACESVLAPIVLPNAPKPTLGTILSAIEAKPSKFKLGLESSSRLTTNVETLIGMLRLIWPNPDRHGTGSSRPPTEEEARAVVHLSVLVVNWVRQGTFTLA